MKLFFSFLFATFVSISTFSQQQMLVFLKDKGNYSLSDIESQFSQRSLNRRAHNNVAFSEKDVAVNPMYLHALAMNGTIKNVSRWLNAVSFESNFSAEELMEMFDFIQSIQTIGAVKPQPNSKLDLNQLKALNYGASDTQIRQLNLDCLHDLGNVGNGIYLAILDAGFNRMDSIEYFDAVFAENRILDKHNFVNNSTNVFGFSQHGTAVASCIVADKADPNGYVGTAPKVDLALYVSEDVSSETLIEEFNLVAALERCDSVGVNIANISLGYFGFDDSLTNHTYEEMDGATTIAAIGVNTAFSVGILVVASAGNSGPNYIATPADADEVLCVGAVNNVGTYAPFSSVGPSFDQQVKPDVVATGWETWLIVESGELVRASGTSFSSPIMAGAAACLMQSNPLRTVSQIRHAIRASGSQFSAPDSLLGYGIPDFCIANNLLVEMDVETTFNEKNILIYPNPAKDEIYLKFNFASEKEVSIQLIDAFGRTVFHQQINATNEPISISTSNLNSGVYFGNIETSSGKKVLKFSVVH